MVLPSYQFPGDHSMNDINRAKDNKDDANILENLPIRRESLSVQVAEQLQQFIVRGGLRPGDRLPPERELGEQLGVSRTVVREATKQLQERGLLKVMTGSGTYVSKVDPSTVSQSIGLFMWGHGHAFHELLEIRKMLEVEIAGLAAERATEEDWVQLEAAITQMAAGLSQVHTNAASLEEFVQADLRFHQVMAQASKNSLLPLLLSPITDLLLAFSRQASSLPGAPENAIHFHQTLLEHIRSRDSMNCRLVMRQHLTDAEKFLDQMADAKVSFPQ
jgi:GntR family transcriptional repressor for pyruvate dehydrogenase complex